MNQIPITLNPVPITVGVQALDINQLMQVICSNISAFISANVSFFLQDTTDPTTEQTQLFYNITQNLFKGWDAGTGKYQPITQFQPGDTKGTFATGDSPNTGWIVCDGRLITDVPNLSQYQVAVLQSLFGAKGSLPNIRFVTALQGLPGNGAFSSITNGVVSPVAGQIGGIAISSPPQQTEVQSLRDNTETLDGSVIALQAALASSLTQSEAILTALNGAGATLIAKVFCGYA